MQRLFLVLALVCSLLILWFTLAAYTRPHIFHSPAVDRIAAFAAMGLLVGLAFPQHVKIVLPLLVAAAIGSELLQFLRPTRDPRLIDGVMKVAGSCLGVSLAIGLRACRRYLR